MMTSCLFGFALEEPNSKSMAKVSVSPALITWCRSSTCAETMKHEQALSEPLSKQSLHLNNDYIEWFTMIT